MSNTYGLAPYGYGWTAISLLPYSLGLNKFTPTWLIFRLFSVLSIGLLFASLQRLSRVYQGRPLHVLEFAAVFLNPLFVIEMISDAHNDLWMMWPAVLALSFLVPRKVEKRQVAKKGSGHLVIATIVAAVLFIFSSSIKYATIVLLPIMAGLLFFRFCGQLCGQFLPKNQQIWFRLLHQLENLFRADLPILAALVLFIPLLTERS